MRCIIADDEYLVRFSILDMLREIEAESEYRFSSIEQASDGEELLELVESVRPHIVFVDIRMPKVDGLDAIELGRQISPGTSWVILTGYAEFDYAKRAVNLGASDYLLKPASKDDLLEALSRTSGLIMEEKAARRERLEHWLTGILYNTLSEDKEQQGWYYSGELLMPPRHPGSEQEFARHRRLVTMLHELSDGPEVIDCVISTAAMDDGALVLMYQASTEENLKRDVEKYRSLVELEPDTYIRYQLTGSYDSLSVCIANLISFSRHPTGLLGFPPFTTLTDAEVQSYLARMHTGSEMMRRLMDCMRSDEPDLTRMLSLVREDSPGFGKILSGSFIAEHMTSLTGREFPDTVDGFSQLLEELGSSPAESGDPILRNRIVNRALVLIDEQYSEEIGLSQIADQLSVTPNYLSYEFHRELGQTFTQYITALRLEKARELLSLRMYSVKEIASLIGYSSSKHFSKVFKQQVGLSPTEYLQTL